MCRWLSYLGEPVYLERFLFEQEYSLIEQSLRARRAVTTTNGDGFGVGWYGDRDEPGVFREVLPAWNDSNLRTLAHHIRSTLFFAHVRASTGTATMRANCHPFTAGRWLFMHNGQIGGYEKVRRALDNTLNDDLFLLRTGTTDSEAMFLHFLSHAPDQNPKAALEAMIRTVCEVIDDADHEDPFRMTVSFSDGERLFAARYSTDPNPPTLYYRQADGHVVVVSEPLDDVEESWIAIPPSGFLECGVDHACTVTTLDV